MSPGRGQADDLEEGQQVAALCWRRVPSLEILLITSLRTRRWILPKGWPIPGLTLAQSAAHEAREEAGVLGEIAPEPFASYSYLKERKTGALPCTVDIFALKVTRQEQDWPEMGKRDQIWLPAEKAARRVSENTLGQIIREFRKSRSS